MQAMVTLVIEVTVVIRTLIYLVATVKHSDI